MPKSTPKARKGHSNHQDDPKNRKRGIIKRDYSQPKPHHQPSQKTGKVPFVPQDRVLLVGEGDFSFARALTQHLSVRRVVATCFDGEKELRTKYPHVGGNLVETTGGGAGLDGGEDDLKDGANGEEEWNGFSSPSSSSSSDESISDSDFILREDLMQTPTPSKPTPHPHASIHFSINATKLSTSHKRLLSPSTPFSKIVFNFPHVGGLSTDVNRQVRSNQELLVGFFNAAKGLLASAQNPVPRQEDEDVDVEVDFDLETGEPLSAADSAAASKGQIIVTLFEGEPYSLWNIRDLARHCGLRVVESFRFPWGMYPGYKHARTTGEIAGRAAKEEGKRPGAWRGEEREARMFVLEVKEEEVVGKKEALERKGEATGGNEVVIGQRKRKRKQKGEMDGEESDGSE
jgi:25S rRNA (uracil2634-N3)-methyltransferase